MPTSRIRSASQGYTELIGVAELQGNPQLAPLSNTLCLWWRYEIEQYRSSGKSSHWVTVDKRASSKPFYLRDDTGLCQIDPAGADISCRHRKVWRGATRHPPSAAANLTATRKKGLISSVSHQFLIGNLTFGQRYRYTEQMILSGDPLYALGHFESDVSGQRTLNPKQVLGNILTEWKQDFSSLLKKFDADGNGQLDLTEWEAVRTAASKEAIKRRIKNTHKPVEHSLSRPTYSGLPFIINSTEQEQLSHQFRRRSFFYAVGFLLVGTLDCWLATSRFF